MLPTCNALWFGYKTSGELSRITLRPNTHIGLTMFIANLSVAEALDSLKTTEQGLTHAEAQRRLREFGYNRLEVVKQKSILLRFFSEFTHFFAIILWKYKGKISRKNKKATGIPR